MPLSLLRKGILLLLGLLTTDYHLACIVLNIPTQVLIISLREISNIIDVLSTENPSEIIALDVYA